MKKRIYIILLLVLALASCKTPTPGATNHNPIARITVSSVSVNVGQEIYFDGSSSSDPDAGDRITSYFWDFGDGNTADQKVNLRRSYARAGVFTVTLTVKDSHGASNSTSKTIEVTEVGGNKKPHASFSVTPVSPKVNKLVYFDASPSFDSDGQIDSYQWVFGDGQTGTGKVTQHAYTSAGEKTVSLTVTDNKGAKEKIEAKIFVATQNKSPEAFIQYLPLIPKPFDEITFSGTFSRDDDGTIATYSWNFGDGNFGSGETFKHKYYSSNVYIASLTVTDNDGLSDTTSSRVSVEGRALKAEIVSLSTDEDYTYLTLTNTGSEALDWSIIVKDDPKGTNPQSSKWFKIDHLSGHLGPAGSSDEADDIKLTVLDTAKAGDYISTLIVNYQGGPTLYDVIGHVDAKTGGSFSLSTAQSSKTVTAGNTAVFPISISRSGGFSGSVDLSVSGLASGMTASFSDNSTTGNSSTVTVAVANTVAAGDYDLTVRGTSGNLKDELRLTVKVANPTVPATFSLTASPANLAIRQDATGSSTIKIIKSGSFSANVALTATNLPSGVTAKFDPSSTSTESELTITVSKTATPGNYEITVNGNGGGESSTVKLGLTINKINTVPEDASISGKVITDNSMISIDVGTQTTAAISQQTLRPGSFVAGQLLITYNENSFASASLSNKIAIRQTLAKSLADKYNYEVISSALPGQPDLVQFPENFDVITEANLLAQDPSIKIAEPNYYIELLDIPNDKKIGGQWNMAAAGLPVTWHTENGSSNNVVVAVIDSGFDLDHPDLVHKFLPGYDFCGRGDQHGDYYTCKENVFDSDPSNGNNDNQHGTHVAGIIGAEGDNSIGVAGAAYGSKVKMVPIKIFNDLGGGLSSVSVFVQSIRWAAGLNVPGAPNNANPAKIINISAGGAFESATVQQAIDDARAAGALVIAATGNGAHADQKILSPAAMKNVVGVGSINQAFKRSCFSNYVAWNTTKRPGKVDIVAPGGELGACSNYETQAILSTVPNNDYGFEAGTSMATPLVSGVAALILSKNPGLSVSALESKLLQSAHKAPYMNTSEYGVGAIRAEIAFGLPKPGDTVSVTAQSDADSGLDNVKLNLFGSSDVYKIDNLKPGNYTVEATVSGSSQDLNGTVDVGLLTSENKTAVNVHVK